MQRRDRAATGQGFFFIFRPSRRKLLTGFAETFCPEIYFSKSRAISSADYLVQNFISAIRGVGCVEML